MDEEVERVEEKKKEKIQTKTCKFILAVRC